MNNINQYIYRVRKFKKGSTDLCKTYKDFTDLEAAIRYANRLTGKHLIDEFIVDPEGMQYNSFIII
jgi:hypothetical protein